MLHILPAWSLYPGASSDMVAAICCGRQAFWTCHRDGMEHYWVYVCQTQTGHGWKSLRSHKSWETVKWERGHFLCKEIKAKRKIKVWFPASWFVFCTEIPFFLSDFAETTIAPLPVLVTMTPLTPSLGGAAPLHSPQSGRVTATRWLCEYKTIQQSPTTFWLSVSSCYIKMPVRLWVLLEDSASLWKVSYVILLAEPFVTLSTV